MARPDQFPLDTPILDDIMPFSKGINSRKVTIEILKNVITADSVKETITNINYYISPTGSDTNDGLSPEKALKTIAKAVSLIPQVVNHTMTIQLVGPSTFPETILLTGFVGNGKIIINGGISVADAINYNVNAVKVYNCNCNISIIGVNVISTSDHAYYSLVCPNITFQYCRVTANDSSHHGFYIQNSLCYIGQCMISNRLFGIRADRMSVIASSNNEGSNNSVGISAGLASTIGKIGTQCTGTSNELQSNGGEIR